jgi:hypothetical protein
LPAATPVPLYVPPAGVPPASAKGASVAQTAASALCVTVGKALTVLVIPEVVAVQPAAFVAVQVTICPVVNALVVNVLEAPD